VQPQLQALKERYPDDKVKQQQEMMEIYKKEKINPIAGCLPVAIQIPVFFSLYKVLFVTIEMRHAPFYGWIKDLSATETPFLRRITTACSISPLASVRACLQSIIGAPVFSRRSFTCAAEIFAIVVLIINETLLVRKDVACYVPSRHERRCKQRLYI
jgi:YidC/Oxa1 family membrane protein insertase